MYGNIKDGEVDTAIPEVRCPQETQHRACACSACLCLHLRACTRMCACVGKDLACRQMGNGDYMRVCICVCM